MQAINITKVTSVDAVLAELAALTKSLPGSELAGLITFNKAYQIVTSVIKTAADERRFANPKFIEKFSVCFAIYYFQAINDCLTASDNLVPAWAKAIKSADSKQRPAFVWLLMGANAHINYDLPLALLKVMDKKDRAVLLKDLIKVDKLLMKSGKQILDTFNESSKLVNFVKRRLRLLYFSPVMHMILFWRVIAWRNYKALDKNNVDTSRLLKRSTKQAKHLMWLGEIIT